MYYYKIAPLIKTALERDPLFTYSAQQKISPGSLVEIEFHGKKTKGIVFDETKKPKFAVKQTGKTVIAALLTAKQIAFAEQISATNFTSLGVVLKFFIPSIGKKEPSLPQKLPVKTPPKPTPLTLTAQQEKAIQSIINNKKAPSLVFGPASSGKTELIMGIIHRTLAKGEQSLVLIPEIFLSYQEIERYTKRFGKDEVVIVHSRLKPSEISLAWYKIKQGLARVIIATRTGLFLPFKNLGFIALDEEQDPSHKQWDQSPRYHARELLPLLAKQFNARIALFSATPSLESLVLTEKEKTLIKVPSLQVREFQVKPPQIMVVDMRKYYFKNKNRPVIFTDELKEALRDNLKNHKLGLILVARRGKSSAVICDDCSTILRCGRCDAPLISSDGNYSCLHCNYKISTFAKCPKCGSFRMKAIGFGTEKAAEDIKSHFPGAKIAIADQNTFAKEKSRAELYDKVSKGEVDILIGSQSIIKGFDLPRVGVVAILNADNWSGQSDFRFDEHWLGNLFQLSGRLNRPGSDQKGLAVIQTYHPENPLLDHLKQWDWNAFAQKEIASRKALSFPPYSRLVKLTYRDKDSGKVDKASKLIYTRLIETHSQDILDIFPPYYGYMKKIRDKWHKHILLKSVRLEDERLLGILKELSKDWVIDTTPDNIF